MNYPQHLSPLSQTFFENPLTLTYDFTKVLNLPMAESQKDQIGWRYYPGNSNWYWVQPMLMMLILFVTIVLLSVTVYFVHFVVLKMMSGDKEFLAKKAAHQSELDELEDLKNQIGNLKKEAAEISNNVKELKEKEVNSVESIKKLDASIVLKQAIQASADQKLTATDERIRALKKGIS